MKLADGDTKRSSWRCRAGRLAREDWVKAGTRALSY